MKKAMSVKFRKPVARKATMPMSTKKGKRGYDRKREKAVSKDIGMERNDD